MIKSCFFVYLNGTFAIMKSIDRDILHIAIPAIISNITVPLLGIVDLTITGHLGNDKYIGAISVGSMIFNIIYWIFGFLRMGTSGMTSQAYGRHNDSEIMELLKKSLAIGVMMGLAFIILQWPVKQLARIIMSPSDAVWQYVSVYYDICIWGAPAMLSLYGLNGWFIGMHDTKTPMFVAIMQNVINIIASLTFVLGFGMSIEGVALGTVTAQWSGFLLALYMMRQRSRRLLVSKSNIIKWSKFFSVNRDIFLRTLFLVSVNLFFTSAGARQGDLILSANTLLLTLFTIFSYVMDGFAFAAEALCGTCYGAKDNTMFDITCKRLYLWGFLMMALFTIVYAVGGRGFLNLITDNQEVIAVAMDYFWWAVLIPAAGVMAFVYDGIFIGMTATRGMLVSSVISSIIFFVAFFTLFYIYGNNALWGAFILYLASRGLLQCIILHKM